MGHKDRIHDSIEKISNELHAFIKENEVSYENSWVPAAYIKNALKLNFVAVPRERTQYGKKG